MRVLFLSLEKPHYQMFLRITKELKLMTHGKTESRIVDTTKIVLRRHSWIKPYKTEIERCQRIIQKARPDIIVVANDQGINGTFIRLSRLRGIPSLAIQDGMLTETTERGIFDSLRSRNYLLWRIFSRILDVPLVGKIFFGLGFRAPVLHWGTGSADRLAAMGDNYKRLFISRGVAASKVIVTGYPLLDDVPNCPTKFRKEKILEKVGLGPKGPLILLITSAFVEDGLWSQSLRDKFMRCVLSSVKHVGGKLIIRVHPREGLEYYKTLADSCSEIDLMVTKNFELDELLLASDVILTVASTAGLWALAYNKPLVVMHCFFPSGKNLYDGMAVTVDSRGELPRILRVILQKAETKTGEKTTVRNTLLDHVYRLDGRASERIARLIVAMTSKAEH